MTAKPKKASAAPVERTYDPRAYRVGTLCGVGCPWCLEVIIDVYLFLPMGRMTALCPHCDHAIVLTKHTTLVAQQADPEEGRTALRLGKDAR